VKSCVLDTDVVIAALDRSDAHHRAATKALMSMIDDGVSLDLSAINYAETLVRPAEREESLRAAVAAIDALGVEIVPPTPSVARDAARLRARRNISLADGFALATARATGSDLASFDRRVRRALPGAGLQLPATLRPRSG
jgi:predicted nucleic acid-binding protein